MDMSFLMGSLCLIKKITNDPELTGQHGEFNGEVLHFNYRNAQLIKNHIMQKNNFINNRTHAN